MDFAVYLRESGRSAAEIARQVGVDASYISHLRSGRRHPSMKLVARINDVTGGTVGFNDWLAARVQNPTPWKGE